MNASVARLRPEPRPAATVAKLRRVLSRYFDEPLIFTAQRFARAAGTFPAGKAGRDGVGSASVGPREAVLLLLALASDASPRDAQAAAQRIGERLLLRRDTAFSVEYDPATYDPAIGTSRLRSTPYEGPPVTFLDFLISEIERGYPPPPYHDDLENLPRGWGIGEHEVWEQSPDRMIFGDGTPDDLNAVRRLTMIPWRLLFELSELFRLGRDAHDPDAAERYEDED